MNPFQKYKSASAASTEPVRQLLFVFDELLKLMYVAQKALGEQDHETKYKALTKIEETITILRSGLDVENDKETALIALDRFYESITNNVRAAHFKAENPEDMAELIKAMSTVRDSLKGELENQKSRKASGGAVPPKAV